MPWHWAMAAIHINHALSLPHHLGQSASTWLNSLTTLILRSPFPYKFIQLKSRDSPRPHMSKFSLCCPADAESVYFSAADSKSLKKRQCLCVYVYGKASKCNGFVGTQLAVLLFELKEHFEQTRSPSPFLPWCFIKMSRSNKLHQSDSNHPQKRTTLMWGILLLGSHSVRWVVNKKKVFELSLFPKLLVVDKRRVTGPCFFVNLHWPQHVIDVAGSVPAVLGEGGLLNSWQGLASGYLDKLS